MRLPISIPYRIRLIKGQLGYEHLPKRQAGVAPEPVGNEGRAEQQGEGLR